MTKINAYFKLMRFDKPIGIFLLLWPTLWPLWLVNKGVPGFKMLLIFVLGSAIVGIAGAMMVTYDGLFSPGSYRPMRYTFLIWVMVIVGGSGNNFGAILGGFAVWFLWIEAAPIALFLINFFTSGMEETNAFRVHLIDSIPYFRYLMMGIGLLLIMRYRPKGILPEKIKHDNKVEYVLRPDFIISFNMLIIFDHFL